MKFGSWYVVEVSHRANNPIHRVVASHYRDGKRPSIDLHYPGETDTTFIGELEYFRVVEEIASMRDGFPNEHKVPKDAVVPATPTEKDA